MTVPARAVVFDLDGTLIDSMSIVLRAYAHALQPYLPAMTESEITQALGGPPARFFETVIPDRAQAAAALARLQDFSGPAWKLIEPFSGAGALLAELRAASVGVGVWTGRERDSTLWLLERHGLAPSVDACVCGDDLDSHKPDPAGLRVVLQKIGVDGGAAWFVGDADVDVLAGAALGVRTVLITHGRQISPAVRAQAWRVVEQSGEAYQLLRNELKLPLHEA